MKINTFMRVILNSYSVPLQKLCAFMPKSTQEIHRAIINFVKNQVRTDMWDSRDVSISPRGDIIYMMTRSPLLPLLYYSR